MFASTVEEDEEEEREEEERRRQTEAAAAAKAKAEADAAAAAAKAKTDAAAAAAAATAAKKPTSPAMDSDAAVSSALKGITTELRTSGDADEALARFSELNWPANGVIAAKYQSKAVERFLEAGLDCERESEREYLGKAIALLAPRGACSEDAVLGGVKAFCAIYDELATDYPKLADYLNTMLAAVVRESPKSAGKGFVPAALLPKAVAAKMGVAAAPEPMLNAAAVEAQAEAEADAGENQFAGLKKKKKKNMADFAKVVGDDE
jgi:hypothetical protein